jgi:hypothetical protein
VTPAYAAEMRHFFPGVAMDDLTGMRAVGVDARFVREMERSFGRSLSPDEAIEARAVGLSASVRGKVREATAAARGAAHDVDIDVDVDPDPDPED